MPTRILLLLVALAATACSDEAAEPLAPSDPDSIVENRGELLVTGIRATMLDGRTPWLWLNDREAAFLVPGDAEGELGAGVWVMDVRSYERRRVLELDDPRSLDVARAEGRLYVTAASGLYSLDPREPGADAVRLATAPRSLVAVSPNGRYRLEELPGGDALLIDTSVGDTTGLESVDPNDRVTDGGTLLFTGPTSLGALDISNRTVRSWEYPSPVGDLREIRGPAENPEVTFAEQSGGARTLQANGSSQGFAERYRAMPSGPIQSSTFDAFEVVRSPEGWRFVFAVVRDVRATESGPEWAWEIVVLDAASGRSTRLATGISAGVLPRGLTITPDGDWLVYGVEDTLYRVSLD